MSRIISGVAELSRGWIRLCQKCLCFTKWQTNALSSIWRCHFLSAATAIIVLLYIYIYIVQAYWQQYSHLLARVKGLGWFSTSVYAFQALQCYYCPHKCLHIKQKNGGRVVLVFAADDNDDDIAVTNDWHLSVSVLLFPLLGLQIRRQTRSRTTAAQQK